MPNAHQLDAKPIEAYYQPYRLAFIYKNKGYISLNISYIYRNKDLATQKVIGFYRFYGMMAATLQP